MTRVIVAWLVVFGLVLAGMPTSSSATQPPTATPSDACEPDDTPATACPLALGSSSGVQRLPPGDVDYLRLTLGETPAPPLDVRVQSSQGLDWLLTITQDGRTLATLNAATPTRTLAGGLQGDVLLRIENLSFDGAGTYRVTIAPQEPTATPEPTATSTPTATPGAANRPDTCEPNDTPQTACPLDRDQVSALFTLLPAGDIDYYQVALGPADGTVPVVRVSGAPALALVTTMSTADGTVLAVLTAPEETVTLPTTTRGTIVLRVESRATESPVTGGYRVEVRRLIPTPTATGTPQPTRTPRPTATPAPTRTATPTSTAAPTATAGPAWAQPDALENNWNVDTAATISLDGAYRLNLVCPVVAGCAGGDHDWVTLPLKQGTEVLVATTELQPGVDTVLTLAIPRADGTLLEVGANDDAYTGQPGSLVRWRAPFATTLVVVVAPRHGRVAAQADGLTDSAYTLVVSTPDRPLGQALLAQQPTSTALPPAVPRTTSGPVAGNRGAVAAPPAVPAPVPPVVPPPPVAPPPAPPAPPVAPASTTTGPPPPLTPQPAPTGAAVVITPTRLLTGPNDAAADLIVQLPVGAEVTLLGQATGLWVFVETADGVRPGWVSARDLRRGTSANTSITPVAPPRTIQVSIAAERPLPDPPPPTPVAQEPVPITVHLVQTRAGGPVRTPVPGAATPTPDLAQLRDEQPLVGMRVQLVTVFGAVLTEAVTPADGRVTLTRDVAPGTALWVLIPAAGVLVPVDPADPELVMAIPVRAGGPQ